MTERRQCTALKRGGGRCRNTALDSSDYCYAHSSERADERREYARAGGKARSRRSPDELETIKGQVKGVAAGVLQGTLDRGTAAILFQGFNVLLRSIEVQRRLDYQTDLEAQVAELRERLEEAKRRRAWGG